jgi:hypothetical protein
MYDEIEMGAWDNRFGVAVNRMGRWTTIAYADHADEADEVAEKARKRYPAVRITQAGEVIESFGEEVFGVAARASGSLLGPNPRVKVDLDDADLTALTNRVDKLTTQLQRGITLGGVAFSVAAVLLLINIFRARKSG